MDYSKLAALVMILSEKTKQGKVTWTAAERPKTFQAAFANSAVRISLAGGSYAISVFNEEGTEIETARDFQLENELGGAEIVMSDLYDSARRQAMGVDEVLNSLLKELEQ